MLTVYMNICILIQTKWLSVNRRTYWSSHIYRLIWTCSLYQQCSYSESTSSLEPRTPHPCSTNQPLTHENILARTVWLELSCHVPGFKRQRRKSHLPDQATGSVRARTVSIAHPLKPHTVLSTVAPTASMGRFPSHTIKRNRICERKCSLESDAFSNLLPTSFLFTIPWRNERSKNPSSLLSLSSYPFPLHIYILLGISLHLPNKMLLNVSFSFLSLPGFRCIRNCLPSSWK